TQRGRGLVRALQELEQRLVRAIRIAYTVVGQQELAEILTVEGSVRLHGRVLESGGSGICVGIEGRIRSPAASGPEAAATDLVGVRLARDPVGQVRNSTWMLGSPSSGEAGDRQIGRAPEEVDGAALPDEASPEALEDAVGLHEHAPEPVGVLAVVFSGSV